MGNKMKIFFIPFLLVMFTGMIGAIPWWSFVIPVLLSGAFLTTKIKNPAFFPIGFMAGFTAWSGSNLFFHLYYNGMMLKRLGPAAEILAFIIPGIICGLLTGLAMYTGKLGATAMTSVFFSRNRIEK